MTRTRNISLSLGVFAASLAGLIIPTAQAQSKTEKEAAVARYKGKLLLVKKDGISTGPMDRGVLLGREGMVNPSEGGAVTFIDDAGNIQISRGGTEPVRKGEVLKITSVFLFKVHKASHGVEKGVFLNLTAENVSPHSITRGIGAFEHQSVESGRAFIRFRAGLDLADFTVTDALIAQWFTLLDGTNSADAARLGNTATGVFVNQVKMGMSFAEVESSLGVPQTRVDLGEKVLYKYKDMTVEFRDGKVADVR